MTIEEALALLEKHHIHRSSSDAVNLMLYHDDGTSEQIGEVWNVSRAIYLADYIPSQLGLEYRDVQKSLTLLDSQRSPIRLQSILDDLPRTVQRYEESQRYEKIDKIKQYFSKRNMKIKIIPSDAEIPDPPDEGTLYIR